MRCPNCKEENKDDARFCRYCGTQFDQATVAFDDDATRVADDAGQGPEGTVVMDQPGAAQDPGATVIAPPEAQPGAAGPPGYVPPYQPTPSAQKGSFLSKALLGIPLWLWGLGGIAVVVALMAVYLILGSTDSEDATATPETETEPAVVDVTDTPVTVEAPPSTEPPAPVLTLLPEETEPPPLPPPSTEPPPTTQPPPTPPTTTVPDTGLITIRVRNTHSFHVTATYKGRSGTIDPQRYLEWYNTRPGLQTWTFCQTNTQICVTETYQFNSFTEITVPPFN